MDMDKLHSYQGLAGRWHEFRDELRTKWHGFKENQESSTQVTIDGAGGDQVPQEPGTTLNQLTVPPEHQRYKHIYRTKSHFEMVRISAAVAGIEFAYAAETAFVSPRLLELGIDRSTMTFVWATSPILGFFLTPFLGSLSDRCSCSLGRRRPFIIFLGLGILIGLLLVPNSQDIGVYFGDTFSQTESSSAFENPFGTNGTTIETSTPATTLAYHPWSIALTILGTTLLDFDADACQSPARAYLLDITIPEDHARGLSTFTIMAGFGGFLGYILGAINWDDNVFGEIMGGQLRAVFSLVAIILVICVTITLTSFRELPLALLETKQSFQLTSKNKTDYGSVEDEVSKPKQSNGSDPNQECSSPQSVVLSEDFSESPISLKHYLWSIIKMPFSMRILCLTNFFCWMAHVCYSLYFTDFVGEAVYNGDPTAPPDSELYLRYKDGVRFGCWGMAAYSISCAFYSLIIERLIKRLGARQVYIGGLMTYALGMIAMGLTCHPIAVVVFSASAGILYSTLFTMPYLLVAHYHASGQFAEGDIRGLGTDVGVVSSMVFLAQFLLSFSMGPFVSWLGTTTAVVYVAAGLSTCGAISSYFIVYLDL